MIILYLFLGCNTEPEVTSSATTAPSKPVEASVKKEISPSKIDVKAVPVSTDILAPSPLETERAVQRAGLTTTLGTLVKKKGDRGIVFTNATPDKAALQTGVLLCDLILSLESLPKEEALNRLDQIIAGMTQMKVGG